MKEIVEQILSRYGFLATDAENMFAAMGDILHEAAEKTKREEPYATESIRELETFASKVNDYDYFLDMHS